METKHQKLLKKFEEKKHRMEFIKEFQETTNKWQFLVDHPSVFGGSTGTTPVIQTFLLPNGTTTQTYSSLNDPSHAAVTITSGTSTTFSFVVPYKITFTIGYNPAFTNSATKNPGIFIRDLNVVPTGQGDINFPDVSNGNNVMVGPIINSGATPGVFASFNTTGFGPALETAMGGTIAPVTGALWTIKETVAGSVQINIFDGANYNTHTYYTVAVPFATSGRNIALFHHADGYVPNDNTTTTFTVAPTVIW